MSKWTAVPVEDIERALKEAVEVLAHLDKFRKNRRLHPLAVPLAAVSAIHSYCLARDGDPRWWAELLTTKDLMAFLRRGLPQ